MQTLVMLFLGRCRMVLLWGVVLSLLLPSSSVLAMDVATPFSVSDSSPLVQIYGLPEIGRAFLLSKGQGQVELSLLVTNNFLHQSNAMEELELDGESYRYRLRWELAPIDKLELGLEVPYLVHNGGELDHFIDEFHQTIGTARGQRARLPKNRLSYRYRSGTRTLLDFSSSKRGLGDLRLTTAWQLFRRPDSALALRGSVKFPTGDSERLTGSGGTDLAVWLSGARNFATGTGPVSLYGALGGLRLGDTDVLPELQRHLVAFGGLGAGWSPWQWLKLQLQVDAHSAFYQETQLKALSNKSMMLTLGGVFALSQSQEIELALVEDILLETAPDVAFLLAWRYRY